MENYLDLKNISLSYQTKEGEIEALQDISLSVQKTEFVSIVGPSGCGKTTILSLIAGLIKPSSGDIFFEGNRVENKIEVGYMFQRDNLFEWRTIYKNIMLGLELKKMAKDIDAIQRVDELLKKYDLYEFKNKYPSQLSGGMRQRVALIRTLAMQPKIMLLDEPFSALDYQTKLNVCEDVHSIITNEKQTVIGVTHDISEAISMANRIIILTKRPARVKNIVKIDIAETSPLKRRESSSFPVYFDKIWKELSNEKKE